MQAVGTWTKRTYTIKEASPGYWGYCWQDEDGRTWWNTQRHQTADHAVLEAIHMDLRAAAQGDGSDLDEAQFTAECEHFNLGSPDPESYEMVYGDFWLDPSNPEASARFAAQQALCMRHRRWLIPRREAAKKALAEQRRTEGAAKMPTTIETTLQTRPKAGDEITLAHGVRYRVTKAKRVTINSSFSYPGIGCCPELDGEPATIVTAERI